MLEDGRRWGDAAAPFQWQDARAVLDPSSLTPYHFQTRARGGSKTSDEAGATIAAMLTQLGPGSRGYGVAADAEQARLLVTAIAGFARRTPELRDALRIDAHRVTAVRSGVTFETLPADAASSWGLLPSWVVIDELAQWPETAGAQEVFDAVTSAAAKVADARLVVLTTAGSPGHWSRRILDHALGAPLWRVHEVPGPPPFDRPVRAEAASAFVWSPEAVGSLLAASSRVAAKRLSKFDYTPLLRLTAALGLRLGETLGLTWADFVKDADDGAGVLHVRRQWLTSGVYGPPKTPKAVRSIPLPPGVRDELIALRLASRFSQNDDPVFASLSGSPLQHRNVARRGFEAARDEAKLPQDLTFHDLRHAAASRLIRAGLDPVTVAGVLGHADATTTLRVYGHLWDAAATAKAIREALASEG